MAGPAPDTITLGSALTTAMSVDLGGGGNKLVLAGVSNTGTIANIADPDRRQRRGSHHTGDGGYWRLDRPRCRQRHARAGQRNQYAPRSPTRRPSWAAVATTPSCWSSAAAGASIDLGAGADKLTFGTFTNSATVANAETIIGGAGNDSITLATALIAAMAHRPGRRQQQADPRQRQQCRHCQQRRHSDRRQRQRCRDARHGRGEGRASTSAPAMTA